MKRTGKLLLILLLTLLTAIPFVLFAAAGETEIVDRGTYGVKIKWTLDANGTLKITGKGKMEIVKSKVSFSPNGDSPWRNHSRIKSVIVSPGITTIGPGVFLRCENLEYVTLPETLTKVYSSAFYGCDSLKYVFFAGGKTKWDKILVDVDLSPLEVFSDAPLRNADIRFGVVDWGTCGAEVGGNGAIWIYDDTKTLTFTGSGAVTGPSEVWVKVEVEENCDPIFSAASTRWEAYLEDGCTVVLEEGITRASGFAWSENGGPKELIVLNPNCDLSELEIQVPTLLRGYLGSTVERYADSDWDCLFMPLCPKDYRHTVLPDKGTVATCSSQGYTAGIFCADCGEFFYGHEVLPARTGIIVENEYGGSNDDGEVESACTMTGLVAWLAKLLAFFRNS